MKQIFGSFVEQGKNQEYLVLNFSPSSVPLQQRWRNNGLSADFVADYWATFFPVNGMFVREHNEIKGTISYIVNELLENAMKFSYKSPLYSINLSLYLYQDELKFYASNGVDLPALKKFQHVIHKLLTEEPKDLYIRQLEKNAEGETDATSGLGFLTIINDYNARLAWKFECDEHHPEIVVATTMVQVMIDYI